MYFRLILENLESLTADLKETGEKKIPPHIFQRKKVLENKLLQYKVEVTEFGRTLNN